MWTLAANGAPLLLEQVTPDHMAGINAAYAEYFSTWGLASMILVAAAGPRAAARHARGLP